MATPVYAADSIPSATPTDVTPTTEVIPTPTETVTPTPEITPDTTPTPIVEEIIIPTPSPEPTATPASEPTVTPEPTPTPTPVATPSPSPWTFEKVELNKEYVSPQNSEVKLTFTKLPTPAGNIKIEEIILTEDQVKQTGSLSDKAYDITSDMKDGDFSYNLSLPIPESSKGKSVEVKFAEDISGINSAEKVDNTLTKTDTSVSVTNLNHFTIFVVSGLTASPLCTDASITPPGETTACYSTIQAAIDAANPDETINVSAGTYTGNLTINKSLTLSGVGNTTIISGSVESTGDSVTIKNLKVTNAYPHPGYGIKATAGKTLSLENVTVDVLHDGVYMKSVDFTNTTTINISDSDITGYSAIELADPSSIYNDNNAAINVNISNTDLIGTTSYSGASNDYQTIGIDYTNNVHIVFSGTNSVKNEFTNGATRV